MIQLGGVYTIFCQEEGILLQKYRDRYRRCIPILFKVSGSGVDLIILTMRPEKNTPIIRKQLFCVTDVRAIGNQFPDNLKIILTTPTPHICKIYAPKICYTIGVSMA